MANFILRSATLSFSLLLSSRVYADVVPVPSHSPGRSFEIVGAIVIGFFAIGLGGVVYRLQKKKKEEEELNR